MNVFSKQTHGWKHRLCLTYPLCHLPPPWMVPLVALLVGGPTLAQPAASEPGFSSQRHSAGAIEPVNGLFYTLEVVHFESPRRVSTGAGVQPMDGVIEVLVQGRGLEGSDLTPVLFLNGYRSERTHVTPDGHRLLGWFYGVSLQELSHAAAQQQSWSLVIAPRPGVHPTMRISPNMPGAAPGQRPSIHFSTR